MVTYLGRVVVLLFAFVLSGCNDNSDRLVSETDSAVHFMVEDLVEKTNNDTSQYVETIVTVEGFVSEVNGLNNRNTIVLSSKEKGASMVICDMQKSQKSLLDTLQKGQYVSVKGILKGTLNDVIVLNCIITNPSI